MTWLIPLTKKFPLNYHSHIVLNHTGTRLAVHHVPVYGSEPWSITVYDTRAASLLGDTAVPGCLDAPSFLDENTLLWCQGQNCMRWSVPGQPVVFASLREYNPRRLKANQAAGVFAVAVNPRPSWPALLICDAATGARLFLSKVLYDWEVYNPQFSPDGQLLAAVLCQDRGSENLILVWDVRTGRRLRVHMPLDVVSAMAFSREGLLFAAEIGRVLVYGQEAVDSIRTLVPEGLKGWAVQLRAGSDPGTLEMLLRAVYESV